jgi:hypothetical protein
MVARRGGWLQIVCKAAIPASVEYAYFCVSELHLEVNQRDVCRKYECEFVPALGQDKAGIALSTLGRTPINGLRHPISQGTTGWYIWCGEDFSEAPDYFAPLCVEHLIERLPLVSDLLGLSPGHRFLIADGYLDVWYDESLLSV